MSDAWIIRGGAHTGTDGSHVTVLAHATLTPDGAREYARRILSAAADAETHSAAG